MNRELLDKPNTNRQLPEGGSREMWPGRNAQELLEQSGIMLGKLKPCQKQIWPRTRKAFIGTLAIKERTGKMCVLSERRIPSFH